MITLPGKVSFQKIEENLPNLTPDQLNNLFSSVSIAPNSLVGINLKELTKGTDKTFSIRLMKWVEPYRIGGFEWSLFYTEVDHNFKVGDRCFIEGGVYDSDAFINQNIYNAGVDGYKVLYVDRTKIVLDIPFTGDLPTNEEEIDNFVKVYVANTQYEFDFYSQMLSMRDDSGLIENRFQIGLNNFLYLNGTFNTTPTSPSTTYYGLSGFIDSSNIITPTNAPGWYVRDEYLGNQYFRNITNDVLTNNIVPLLNQSFTQSNSGFFNLEKLRIMNSRFESGGVTFMNERIYFYNVDTGKWQVDKSYLPTIITKTHFKDGFFGSGSMNSGLYGVHEKRLSYDGSNIQWNLGTTLNVDWLSGVLDSTVYDPDSFFTIFDRDGLPQIRSNAENNGGSGYNYVFNTEFSGGDVINGNIFNMSTIIGANSLTQSTLLNYYTGQPQNYSVEIKGGVYYNSDISFATMSNSTFISSYVLNSYIERCKSVNSEVESSVFLNSTWISDRIVKIQAYEESNIVWYDELSNPIDYKMYKFYVNDTNWRRLAEFQNFYIDGIEIKIPSDELLRFFDDKFSFGHWSQSYDVPGSKPSRKVLVQLSTKEENRNSPGQIISLDNDLQPNFDNPLPSIDLFISGGDDFNVGSTTSYPRTPIGETIDIKNGYILDSDFISGLFKDSRWISGNYMNYNADYSFSSGSGYTASLTASTAELTLQIGDRLRPELFGTSSNVSTIAFVNGLWYEGIGPNLVKLPDVYKVNGIGGSPSQIFLQDIATQSVLSTIADFTNQTYLKTPGAKNQWNYIHPVKFETSQIFSGVFRRAYFENCLFDNFQFDLEDKDLLDVTNKRKLLVSDVIFDGDGNRIKSGLFQYSHLISGNEDWQNGIFHRGVWNTQIFTYSFSPTSSLTYTTRDVPFKDGIIRNSTWETGNFQNGLFYKNNTNIVGNSQSLSDTRLTYYYEGLNTRWTWKEGEFINGDFERSNFETGTFKDGNFYDSDWFIGVASGGNFGKTNIPFEKTRIWQGTFSNVNVINADFTSGDFLDSNNTQATASIYWNSGVFKKGVFGTKDSLSYSPYLTSNNRSIWKDGIFSGGDFKDSAEWKGGQFDGGRFLSYYWYEPLTPRTPFELNSFTSASFSWQGGKFNGGEFGTGELGKNSTWFTGEFNGGLFKGRYWKDGIFTRGDFLGHASTFSTDSIKSDNSEVLLSRRIDGSENYNEFIRSFNTNYFGYWQGGFVSKVKDKFIKDEKLFTEVERVSTKKKKNPLINFKNMLWNSGTFSAFDGEMDNSVWLDGTFQDGYFVNSAFNPYINLANSKLLFETDLTNSISGAVGFTPSLPISNGSGYYTIENPTTQLRFGVISQTLMPGETYTLQIDVTENTNYEVYCQFINNPFLVVPDNQTGIFNFTFTSTGKQLVLAFFIPNTLLSSPPYSITFGNVVLYPGTQSGFRITDSCIWENGEAYSSDFYFSKWKQGIFDSFSDSLQGNAWGLVWQNGITKYMNAYNVFWENGIWKNGNWNGSPFQQIATYSGYQVYPGFSEDIMNNVSVYASQSGLNSWSSIHMNDTFTGSLSPEIIHNNDFNIGPGATGWSGLGWSISTTYNIVSAPSFQPVVDNVITSNQNNRTVTFEEFPGYTQNVFSTTFSQYVIEVEWAAFIQSNFISSIPVPVLNLRIDVGYVGSSTADDISSNGGIRRFVGGPIRGIVNNNDFYGSISGISILNYTPTNLSNLDSRKLKITRMSHTGDSTGMNVYIKRVSVKTFDYSYDLLTNNELYSGGFTTPLIGSTISLPPSIIYQIGELRSRFGNGVFRSGIWENGVWNEGWRDDETVLWSDNLDIYIGGKNHAYKDDKDIFKWSIKLNILLNDQSPNSLNNFNVGDKVSVGNIVLIDINENRRLIKDYLTVTDKFEGFRSDPLNPFGPQILSGLLTLELQTTFLIRRIERDSDVHLIHISKNVWLNGVFLNGKFINGVWTNGLFTGFPYITEMYDTHWVDGIYKGGRFTGTTSVYIDNKGNTNDYNKSVIQRFIFSDENVSGQPFRFKYNSWIDVNYFETSGVNINRVNEIYVQTPLFYTASYIDSNHYGYPTKDVLESISSIRNAFDLNSRNYKLGWKFKEYTDWIPYDKNGQFTGINQFKWVNSQVSGYTLVPNTLSGLTSGLTTDNLDSLGFEFYYGPGAPFLPGVETEIINNYGSLPIELQNKLILKGGSIFPGIQNPVGPENFNLDYIDNNNIEIERLRYSFVEITADNLGSTVGNPYLFYNNFPGTYSIPSRVVNIGGQTVSLPVNQIYETSVVNQREYFFNKKGLEMSIISGNTTQSIGSYSLAFDKIRLVETDMIPFFQFATDCFSENVLEIEGEEVIENPNPIVPPVAQDNCGVQGITIIFGTDETSLVSSDFSISQDLFMKLFLEFDFNDENGNPVYYNEDWSHRLEVRYNDTLNRWEFVRYPSAIQILSSSYPSSPLTQRVTFTIVGTNGHGFNTGDTVFINNVNGYSGGIANSGPISGPFVCESVTNPNLTQFFVEFPAGVVGNGNTIVQPNATVIGTNVIVLGFSPNLLNGWQVNSSESGTNRYWNSDSDRYSGLGFGSDDTVLEVVDCECGNQTSEFLCLTDDDTIKLIPMYLEDSDLPSIYYYGGSDAWVLWIPDAYSANSVNINYDNGSGGLNLGADKKVEVFLQPGNVSIGSYTSDGSLGHLSQKQALISDLNSYSGINAVIGGPSSYIITISGSGLNGYTSIQVIVTDTSDNNSILDNQTFQIPTPPQEWEIYYADDADESPFNGTQNNPPTGEFNNVSINFTIDECGNGLINPSTIDGPIQPPSINTTIATLVSSTSANSGGAIVTIGGQPLTSAGVVWSTLSLPEVGVPGVGQSNVDNPSSLVNGGTFTIFMTGLVPSTLYYYRAFAINPGGPPSYGGQGTFTTSPTGFILSGVNQGECSLSYINSDIQIPYVAKAPDIDYSDLNFNILNNVNIYIPNVNINTLQPTEDPSVNNNLISFPSSGSSS